MRTQENFVQKIGIVAAGVAFILLIPLLAMQFTPEVNWSIADFAIMGGLLFLTGLSFVIFFHKASNLRYRLGMIVALGSSFLMIWANLAVGLIGSGANAGNILYIAVSVITMLGIFLSNFQAKRLELTMYITAMALIVHAFISISLGVHEYTDTSIAEICEINALFVLHFVISGLLFRLSQKKFYFNNSLMEFRR